MASTSTTPETTEQAVPDPQTVFYSTPPIQKKETVGDKMRGAGSWIKDYSTAVKHGR